MKLLLNSSAQPVPGEYCSLLEKSTAIAG